MADFNPGYTWPNPAFPFRLYLDHPACRIFIIENFSHNWHWMSRYRPGIRETDFFFVYSGCDQSTGLHVKAAQMLSHLHLPLEQFFFLANDETELKLYESVGIGGEIINANCWLDEQLAQILPLEKLYDAIYVGRLVPVKRHYLASNVRNLALVAGNPYQANAVPAPPHVYLNASPLSRPEVVKKINESRVGLILSAAEGACFASSEYLLCGVPVVSTKSRGGRDMWYNDYNSILVEPNPDAVASAVEQLVAEPRDPYQIRNTHINLAMQFRQKFVNALSLVLRRYNATDVDPGKYFAENYYDKMRKSITPDFDVLFPT